jgi:hypothetical protein
VRRALLALLAAGLLAGCSLAPSDDVIRALVASERSWCITINSVYGTARLSGTGLPRGRIVCSQEGMTVTASGEP